MDQENKYILESQRYTQEEFESLSIKNQRLLIIQDALDSITMDITVPRTGCYLKSDALNEYKSIKENPELECYVCELGALLVSTCRFVNILYYKQVEDVLINGRKFDKFNKIFSNEQLLLIECCFEGFVSGNRYGKKQNDDFSTEYISNVSQIANDFLGTFLNTTDRMVAIFINMIYNDGIFIPEQDI